MNRFKVTNDEIAEFVEGIADRITVQRVLIAALADPQIRARIELLRRLDSAGEALTTSVIPADTDSIGEDRLSSLQTTLKESTASYIASSAAPALNLSSVLAASVVREQANQLLRQTQRGGVLPRIADEIREGLSAQWDKTVEGMRSLFVGRSETLTLPCLAPGTAAYAADLQVHRQTVAIAEGVRIEFQQLPASALNRLRVVVDASALMTETHLPEPYNVAFLTLEEGRGGSGPAEQVNLPDRHILVISLNGEGRGYVDLTIGGGSIASASGPSAASRARDMTTPAADLLPAPRSAYSLIGATLSRRDH